MKLKILLLSVILGVVAWFVYDKLCCEGCALESDAHSEAVNPVIIQMSPKDGSQRSFESNTLSIESLRFSAENDDVVAQRKLAGLLLFGDGIEADPAAAIGWARRAAMNGDMLAALWTGRAALNPPTDRIEAAAWFLVAQEAGEAAVSEDAEAELETLTLAADEFSLAHARAAAFRQTILIRFE